MKATGTEFSQPMRSLAGCLCVCGTMATLLVGLAAGRAPAQPPGARAERPPSRTQDLTLEDLEEMARQLEQGKQTITLPRRAGGQKIPSYEEMVAQARQMRQKNQSRITWWIDFDAATEEAYQRGLPLVIYFTGGINCDSIRYSDEFVTVANRAVFLVVNSRAATAKARQLAVNLAKAFHVRDAYPQVLIGRVSFRDPKSRTSTFQHRWRCSDRASTNDVVATIRKEAAMSARR